MNAIQQKCRPKHQVLVLKCYPRTTKGAVDVRPNSSELSYLLFYATSRRSKIQKIGAFLEKKTASDVWRMRIGNVQVTLGILAALVEKSPKDVALIAPCILKILDLVLRSDDITMIESSLPTFEAFCDHHDAYSLFADHAYLQQYQSVVRSYAQLASCRHVSSKVPASHPVQMRWRNAGLGAIKCVSSSDALSSVTGRQIDVIVPMILENMCIDDDFMDVLLKRVEVKDKVDSEKPTHRRMSVATVRTADTAGDTNPLALSGTALDVDKIAEEDLGVLATHCLRSIFVVPNRAQIHAATVALLKFISQKVAQGEAVVTKEAGTDDDAGWAVRIYGIVARWAPVQDRYVILLAALDTMVKTPLKEDSLSRHLALTGMIRSLLHSDTNLIGLSVMDVVLGIVRQIKKLLQLRSESGQDGSSQSDDKTDMEKNHAPPSQRKDLLEQLEKCIGDLATHVYYADQISDMVSALVPRPKTDRSSSTTSLQHGDRAECNESGGPASSTVDLPGSQSPSETHFSRKALRASVLRAIKAVLLVANPKTNISGNMGLYRNRVPITVWEGTQWLLREPDGLVRKAYVDALWTWLDQETIRTDSNAQYEMAAQHCPPVKNSRELPSARRVVSNASHREPQPRGRRCRFLPLLHLAVYDSALQFVDFDNDIALLHKLLTKLVFGLGVNAARYGIPMIYRLQEDVLDLGQPIHKVRVAALCHGFFWALMERFDLESSVVGRAIRNEIARRRSKSFWVEGVRVPPPSMDQIGTPGRSGPQPAWDRGTLEMEELLPFDDRTSLVECIAASYRESSLSPPTSPGASPGRGVSNNPILGFGMNHLPAMELSQDLPPMFRENMLAEWSRDSAMVALSEGKTESLNGSRTAMTSTNQNRLTVGAAGIDGSSRLPASPYGSVHNPGSRSSHAYRERLNSMSRLRKASLQSGSPSPSVSTKGDIATVEQLKMILSGNVSPQAAGIPGVEDDSDGSMVSYGYSLSEASFNPSAQGEQLATTGEVLARSMSGSFKGPLTSNLTFDSESLHADGDGGGFLPPVPPLPDLDNLPGKGRIPQGYVAMQDHAAKPARRTPGSRGRENVPARSLRSRNGSSSRRGMALQELLQSIDSRSGEGGQGNPIRPPY